MKNHLLAVLLGVGVGVCGTACAELQGSQDTQSAMADNDRLDEAINAQTFKKITSVVVAQEGAISYENYWGEGSPETLNDTRSATKTLVAMAVGAAIADGFISGVDEKILKHFDAERPYRFESALKDSITIGDLLTMSSALDCDDNTWESPGNEEHMYPARKWTYFVLDMPTKQGYERDATGMGPMFYCTAGSFFLGQIVERAVGEPIDEYVERRLLKPLGITNVDWARSPSNEVMTGGGTKFSARDLLKLAELLRNRGKYQNQTVLPATWVDAMLTKHRKAHSNFHYGYQIWHDNFACGDTTVSGWYMAGNGGNKVVIIDELDISVVITATLYGTRGMHEQSKDILEDYVLADQSACQ